MEGSAFVIGFLFIVFIIGIVIYKIIIANNNESNNYTILNQKLDKNIDLNDNQYKVDKKDDDAKNQVKQKQQDNHNISTQKINNNSKKTNEITSTTKEDVNVIKKDKKMSIIDMSIVTKKHTNTYSKAKCNNYSKPEKSGGMHLVSIAPRPGIEKRSNKKCKYGYNGKCYCGKSQRYNLRCLSSDCEHYTECIKKDYSKY